MKKAKEQTISRRDFLIQQYRDQLETQRKLALKTSANFATYVDKNVEIEWFHKIVYDNLDKWISGDIKKLAIFMPPQHGKSDMSSIKTPARILGQNPKAKIAVISYSDKLASKFNRKCQDIIDSEEFQSLYPGVVLPAKGIETTNELRNNTYFEIVKHKGFFKAVSVEGQLTGDPIDFGIIDDPIKGRKQANSKTYRDGLWDWYNDVFKTRLHNDSRQLMLFTRWHEDDLAGRLFNPKSEFYDADEASEWTVIIFQALREEKIPFEHIAMKYNDPREIGDALWPAKHSKEKHEKSKKTSPTTFASLQQQRPSASKGNKLKKEWFQIISPNELPFNPDTIARDFFIDGAFTEKSQNDESAQMSCSFYKGNLYIFNVTGVRKELNEYLEFIVPWLKSNRYKPNSSVWIEMKASGFGFYSMLKSPKYGSFNCRKIDGQAVADGKMTRVETIQPTMGSMKVFLVKGGWNESFIEQCCNFPNDTHDDMLDLLCYAIYHYFIIDNEVSVSYN